MAAGFAIGFLDEIYQLLVPGRMTEFLDWVADSAGIIDETYDYWVLGQGAQSHEPRWSIIRDVLGWVD